MQRITPVVTLRSLREAHGIDSPQMAERIEAQGVKVHPDHLLNVELGYKRGSAKLMAAWARALGIKPMDIRQHEELMELVLARVA